MASELTNQLYYAQRNVVMYHKMLDAEGLPITNKKDIPMMHPADTYSSPHRCPRCCWRMLVSYKYTWCESQYCTYGKRLEEEEEDE